jgi:hypothetical protein
MNLLPLNTTLKDQNFANILDKNSKETYEVFKIDPLTCHFSILEHIALEHNIDISNLTEHEIREYLSLSIDNKPLIGTVSSVESAIKFFLGSGELIEWFNDKENLTVGQFSVKTSNPSVKMFLKNIEKFKNIRSHFVSISDGNCSSRMKLDRDLYDHSILSNEDGEEVDGVRVCFKSKSTSVAPFMKYEVNKSFTYLKTKIVYLFNARFDVMKLDSRFSYTLSKNIERYINKLIVLPRAWRGSWNGSWFDGYTISGFSVKKIEKLLELISLPFSISNREKIVPIKAIATTGKTKEIIKVKQLGRAWRGSWNGSWFDGYTIL